MSRNIFSRQQWQLIQRWYSPEDARRIAYQTQVKSWNVVPWTYQLTEKWKQYSELSSQQRNKIRKTKRRWQFNWIN